ncbi:dynamin-like [Numida meleagris]|uniref:dynamin-like n=1 Tax=Numida meleagris TaxID=8996 RepID=UPI000B3E32DF|nr:dynamin-like [Numida meleagris]
MAPVLLWLLALVAGGPAGAQPPLPAASEPACPVCVWRRHSKELRLESIKSQILSKLRLKEAPNITREVVKQLLPKAPPLQQILDLHDFQGDSLQHDEYLEEDEYHATTETVISMAQESQCRLCSGRKVRLLPPPSPSRSPGPVAAVATFPSRGSPGSPRPPPLPPGAPHPPVPSAFPPRSPHPRSPAAAHGSSRGSPILSFGHRPTVPGPPGPAPGLGPALGPGLGPGPGSFVLSPGGTCCSAPCGDVGTGDVGTRRQRRDTGTRKHRDPGT